MFFAKNMRVFNNLDAERSVIEETSIS